MTAIPFIHHPSFLWGLFFALIFGLLAFDLLVISRGHKILSLRKSLGMTLLVTGTAVGFGLALWQLRGEEAAAAYLTVFVVEQSLSVDNVFVMSLIFAHFAIPREYRHEVLMYGVLVAMLLRGVFIALGATIVDHAHWVLLVFGAVLIWTGVQMLRATDDKPEDVANAAWMKLLQRFIPVTSRMEGTKLLLRENGRLLATPLLLAFMAINVADVVFAIDSVPAAFSITQDGFIIFTANTFAVMGLRALFFVVDALVAMFHHLKTSIAVLLGFIGVKIFMDHYWIKLEPITVLGVTLAVLLAGIAASLLVPKRVAH